MQHRHDPRTCETCRDGGEALFQGCMVLFAVLVIAAYVGIGFLLAQPLIHLTPIESAKAYVISYASLLAVGLLAYPVCAIVHMLAADRLPGEWNGVEGIRSFLEAFVVLNGQRLLAEQDPVTTLTADEALAWIEQAEAAITTFLSVDPAQRRALAIHVLADRQDE